MYDVGKARPLFGDSTGVSRWIAALAQPQQSSGMCMTHLPALWSCNRLLFIYLFHGSFHKVFESNRLLAGIFFGAHISECYGTDIWSPIYESSSVWWSARSIQLLSLFCSNWEPILFLRIKCLFSLNMFDYSKLNGMVRGSARKMGMVLAKGHLRAWCKIFSARGGLTTLMQRNLCLLS